MEWWAIALGASAAGVALLVEQAGKCKYAPEIAGTLNGALLAIISVDPSAASAAAAMLLGMFFSGRMHRTGDYLALATYFLAFVMLNESVYLIPLTVIGAAAFVDWKLEKKQSALGKRILTHVAAATMVPFTGWTALITTISYDGAYRIAGLIGTGS